jgi:hypothetical protein
MRRLGQSATHPARIVSHQLLARAWVGSIDGKADSEDAWLFEKLFVGCLRTMVKSQRARWRPSIFSKKGNANMRSMFYSPNRQESMVHEWTSRSTAWLASASGCFVKVSLPLSLGSNRRKNDYNKKSKTSFVPLPSLDPNGALMDRWRTMPDSGQHHSSVDLSERPSMWKLRSRRHDAIGQQSHARMFRFLRPLLFSQLGS